VYEYADTQMARFNPNNRTSSKPLDAGQVRQRDRLSKSPAFFHVEASGEMNTGGTELAPKETV
jgi:hypothetical protein